VKIPVIGIGGIMNATDAIEFLMVGATAVQIGTANYIDPGIGIKIADGITKFCEDRAVRDVGSLVNTLDAKEKVSVVDTWL
jgi:dihydroorotate dehydrogenase (NAD+) catalytic subunit